MGDARAGKAKAVSCAACHSGLPATADVAPRLAGQNATYLRDAMQAYKSGSREHAVMHSLVQSLSSQDMADLAEYWTQLKPSVNKPPKAELSAQTVAERALGERLVNSNNCASCHGEALVKPVDDNIPSLFGMSAAYVEAAMLAYIPAAGQEQGTRRSAMMRYALNISDPKTGKDRFFSQEELRAMARFISQRQSDK